MPSPDLRRPEIVLGLALAGLGVLAAVLVRLGGANAPTGQDSAGVIWRALPQPAAVRAEADGVTASALARRLLDSGLFGAPPDRLALSDGGATGTAAAASAAGVSAVPAFPPVVAAAYVDGRPTVYLRMGEAAGAAAGTGGEDAAGPRITPWQAGTSPVEGWHILDITLNAVRIQYRDDPAETVPVFRTRPVNTDQQDNNRGGA